MKSRFFKTIKPIVIIMALGFIYIIIYRLTGFAIFCPFRKITGLQCPGCGISRMCLGIINFDFYYAFKSNCLLFCLSPIATILYIRHQYRYIRYNETETKKWESVLIYITIGLLIFFGILRNIFPEIL